MFLTLKLPKPLTLGELHDTLYYFKDGDTADDLKVEFDFGGSPHNLHSFRGDYRGLGISRTDEATMGLRYLFSFYHDIDDAIRGSIVFEGYKGAVYRMNRDSLVYICDPNETRCVIDGQSYPYIGIVGVNLRGSSVILQTGSYK